MANLMGTGIGFLISAYADDIELIDLIQALLSLITVPMIFLLRQPNKEDLLDVNFKNELKFLWLNKFLILVFIPISVEFGVIYSLLGILQEVLDVDVILTG